MPLKEQLFAELLLVSTSASLLPLARFLVEEQVALRPTELTSQSANSNRLEQCLHYC